MFSRKFRAGVAVTALVTSSLALAGPALADPGTWTNAPGSGDYSGVGSDTTEIVMNALAGSQGDASGATFNGGKTTGRIASYDATGSSPLTLADGTTLTTRPNGSGAGKALLYGSGNNTHVAFARSSSALSATEASSGLVAYPYAADYLVTVTANSTNAPTALSIGQVLGIYNGTYTNWAQLGGANAPIHPYIPQTGSGTRTFFITQLTNANGGVAPVLAGSVKESQEHDPTLIKNDPDAVAPFSRGRALTGASAGTVRVENGWIAQRALYNVTRTPSSSDPTATALASVFGTSGFLCGTAAETIIKNNGFLQLDGTTCGIANTTSNASAIKTKDASPVPAAQSSLGVTGGVRPFGSGSNAVVTVNNGGSGFVSIYGRGFTGVAPVSGGQAVVGIPSNLPAGSYPITANYSGDFAHLGSTGSGTLTVTRANSGMSVSIKLSKVKHKKHHKAKKPTTYTATVRVAATGVAPTGSVVIKRGSSVIGSGSVRNGVATITFKIAKLKKGKKNVLTVVYGGDGNVNGTSKTVVVKRKK